MGFSGSDVFTVSRTCLDSMNCDASTRESNITGFDEVATDIVADSNCELDESDRMTDEDQERDEESTGDDERRGRILSFAPKTRYFCFGSRGL